jgi:hypothetical protein
MDWETKLRGIFESLEDSNKMPETFVEGIISTFGETLTRKEAEAKAEAKEIYEHRAKRLIQNVKTEANTRMNEMLTKVDEEHANMLEKVFNAQDEAHAKVFEETFKKFDEANSAKLEAYLEELDKDQSNKLAKVKEIYESKEINQKLLTKVQSVIDTYLEKVSPKEVVVDSAKLARLTKMHEQAKVMFAVNDDYMQREVKEAIIEADSKIEEANNKVAAMEAKNLELVESTVALNEKIKKIEATALLESKLKDLPAREISYLNSVFEGKSADVIQGKFDEELSSFRDSETARRSKLKESAKQNSKVPTVRKQNIQEAVQHIDVRDEMDEYVSMLDNNISAIYN